MVRKTFGSRVVLVCLILALAAPALGGVSLAVVGDCEKLHPDSPVAGSDYMWDSAKGTISLHAAKNEVAAFQLVINSETAVADGDVIFGDLSGPGPFSRRNFTAFLELYQLVTRNQGNPGDLPAGIEYPDPLVPLYDPYSGGGKENGIAAPFRIEPGRNTIIWIDCWVPPETAAGRYRGILTLTAGGEAIPVNLDLTVWDFTIPAESHVYNHTLIYRWQFEYHEKCGYGFRKSGWEKMQRYEELLLRHRLQNGLTRLWPDMTFAEDGTLGSIDWTEYDKFAAARLGGTFVREGPTKGAKPPLWFFQFAPIFPNDPDIKGPPLDYSRRGEYEENLLRTLCREVVRHWREKGWTTPMVVALLDESTDWETIRWGARIFHEEGGDLFKYMNTGHYGVQPQLVGFVDIWAPNARNYDPREMAERIADGDMTWFYHSSEPYLGHMIMNTYGVSMRLWDAVAFKYGVDGTFLWVANNWPHPRNWRPRWGEMPSPYVCAAGANGGERFGNGTYLYPGARLPDAGFPAIEGPVPSMRLKVMRRGAQDYEYLWLLSRKGRMRDAEARRILSKVLRSALKTSSRLGDAPSFGIDPTLSWTGRLKDGQGDWSHDAADWHAMRLELADAILRTRD